MSATSTNRLTAAHVAALASAVDIVRSTIDESGEFAEGDRELCRTAEEALARLPSIYEFDGTLSEDELQVLAQTFESGFRYAAAHATAQEMKDKANALRPGIMGDLRAEAYREGWNAGSFPEAAINPTLMIQLAWEGSTVYALYGETSPVPTR